MATTPKKTTSGSRSGGASTGKRTAGGKTKATARGGGRSGGRSARQRPIRREVTGGIFALLAILILVSYFPSDGWLMRWLPSFFKGLLGFGYYLVAPALALGAWILLTHRGRPVMLRTACALLVPFLFGALCHVLFCHLELRGIDGLLTTLWRSGIDTGFRRRPVGRCGSGLFHRPGQAGVCDCVHASASGPSDGSVPGDDFRPGADVAGAGAPGLQHGGL